MNLEFFENWSAEMAYILGFFAADGSMYINPGGSRYFSFYSNDLEILEKIRSLVESRNKISVRKSKRAYVLQIGSKKVFNDLLRLGLTRNKSKILQFPNIPNEFMRDFVRGYFDGDGNILHKTYFRKDRNKYKDYFAIKFISGSKDFLKAMRENLYLFAKTGMGSFFRGDRSFVLSFAMKDSKRLCAFMYDNASKNAYLERKYEVYKRFIDNAER